MKNNRLILSLITMILLSGRQGWAMSVEEIVQKANRVSYYNGDDGRAHIKMTITDKQGRVRLREFVILRKDIEDGGEQRFYVYFLKPEDVRKMVYMVWKHLDRDDDRWLYLPALDLVRRVSASDKRSSFVGSDFLYEDISGRPTTEDHHELIEETDVTYKLKNVPKDEGAVEFAYYTIWIDKATFMPKKAQYYNDQNELLRTIEALEIRNINGFPTVVRSKATNAATGSSTITEFQEVEYNIGLNQETFTERFLRRAPGRWINQ